MQEAQMECPNCGEPVALGDVMCENCGVNLKSGESYESQVKRAKGRTRQKKSYTGGLHVAMVLGFALLLFSGYMYQGSVEEVFRKRSDMFEPPAAELQSIRDMIAAGNYSDARQRAEALAKQLQEQADEIFIKTPFGGTDTRRPHEREMVSDYNHRVARGQLLNMKAKALTLARQAEGASS